MNPWLMLAVMLLLAGLALWLGAAWLMSRMLLRPPRMTDGKAIWVLRRLSPGDLGLGFEDEPFEVTDKDGSRLGIVSWWIPAAGTSNRCVMLIHGYADAKVGVIAWAPLFHGLGWNILALDLRAHGESGGRFITAGHREREDLTQVLDQLRARRPGQTQHLALFGASYGAAMAAAVAAGRDDLAAVILESPFADFASASRAHMGLMGLPTGLTAGLALRLAERSAGGSLNAHAPVLTLPKIAAPVLLIESEGDPFLAAGDSERLAQALTARRPNLPTVHWRISGVGHLMGICGEPEEYIQRVKEFLSSAIRPPSSSCPG